jgi:uroporphyrinogen-III synthase
MLPSASADLPISEPTTTARTGGLAGLRVCSFESRKQTEMRLLIEKQGGLATLAASMREIPLESNTTAFEFGRALFAGEIDVVILLTGVGTRALAECLATRTPHEEFLAALGKTTIVVRGPKPAAVLREWKVRIDHQVPEPNTWRDLLALVDRELPLSGKRVAVQEYGTSNDQLLAGLRERGTAVQAVPVYRWALPEDLGPLEQAIRDTVAMKFDLLLFTSAQQLNHVLEVAERMGLRDAWMAAARQTVIGSIGPTASENCRELGLEPDFEPEHPKMGHLLLAAARETQSRLAAKRTGSTDPSNGGQS